MNTSSTPTKLKGKNQHFSNRVESSRDEQGPHCGHWLRKQWPGHGLQAMHMPTRLLTAAASLLTAQHYIDAGQSVELR